MFRKIRSLLAQRKLPADKIVGLRADDDSILLVGVASPRDRIELRRIDRIVAYKRDMGTSDLVCFLVTFRIDDQSIWHVTLHEDLPGFLDADQAFARLPSYDANWRDRVIKPAFSTNETVIYDATMSDAARAGAL